MEDMEDRIVVDSDILVNFLRNKKEEVELLKRMSRQATLATTDINAFELYYGAYKSSKQDENLAATKGLLNSLLLLSTSEDSMEMAGKIITDLEKRGKPMEIRDLLIGSICLTNSIALLTGNRRHFENMEGLKIIETKL
ncbi:MAG: type II toxin-antitoxin system VapC family toxin [Candidatus Aenigmarchaeota archaeon]|nr:type II toxin-antitoxin system VapC family toxin [Candidatus Aenigmarchaeota archaeon]